MTRVPDNEPAISYAAASPGTPVLTSDGTEIGTLEHVLEVSDLDLFDGIVVATSGGSVSSTPTRSA